MTVTKMLWGILRGSGPHQAFRLFSVPSKSKLTTSLSQDRHTDHPPMLKGPLTQHHSTLFP